MNKSSMSGILATKLIIEDSKLKKIRLKAETIIPLLSKPDFFDRQFSIILMIVNIKI